MTVDGATHTVLETVLWQRLHAFCYYLDGICIKESRGVLICKILNCY